MYLGTRRARRPSPLTDAGTGIGAILGTFFCSLVADPIYAALSRRHGTAEPEFKLPLSVAGSALAPLGILLFGWGAGERLHWTAPMFGLGVRGCPAEGLC